MHNEDNLRPVKTKEEARERGRRGGIASGKVRRQKKDMKQRLQDALELAVVNPNVKITMKQIGMKGEGTNWDAVVASIVAGTIQGTPGYAKLLMELLGEIGSEKQVKVEVSAVDVEKTKLDDLIQQMRGGK